MTIPRNLSALAPNVSTAGAVNVAGGGTGLTATPSNGQIPIGNGSGYALAAISAGNGIAVTNGAGTVSIAQDFYAGSTTGNTSYPIGSYIIVTNGTCATYNVNATITPYVVTAGAETVWDATSTGRAAITGTWRSRGKVGSASGYLVQRTA
jgi:hypothetical protein